MRDLKKRCLDCRHRECCRALRLSLDLSLGLHTHLKEQLDA
jgi:hypothetical protein